MVKTRVDESWGFRRTSSDGRRETTSGKGDGEGHRTPG